MEKFAIFPWNTTDSMVPDDDTAYYMFHQKKGSKQNGKIARSCRLHMEMTEHKQIFYMQIPGLGYGYMVGRMN
jgi:hypothetical protein